MDDRERARARDKTKNFVRGTTCPFFSGDDKMRNASGQQGENERRGKKANRNTSNNIFLRAHQFK